MKFSKYPTVHICTECKSLLSGCKCFSPTIGRAYLVPVRDTPADRPCYAGNKKTPCDCTSYCGDDSSVVENWKALEQTHRKQ